MQKVFVFLFSFYILFLTAIPCVDKPGEESCASTELLPVNGNHQHSDFDHCSPFCTCNCCASPKIQVELKLEIASLPVVLQRYHDQVPEVIFAPAATIWQPPRTC